MARTKPRFVIVVEEDMCKGCGLCVQVCPRRSIRFTKHINSRGFHPAYLADPDNCTGCAHCALMCPDVCIRVLRVKDD